MIDLSSGGASESSLGRQPQVTRQEAIQAPEGYAVKDFK